MKKSKDETSMLAVYLSIVILIIPYLYGYYTEFQREGYWEGKVTGIRYFDAINMDSTSIFSEDSVLWLKHDLSANFTIGHSYRVWFKGRYVFSIEDYGS